MVLLYTLNKNSGLKRLKLSQANLGCTEVSCYLGYLLGYGLVTFVRVVCNSVCVVEYCLLF